jgi:hypothetical protein
MHSVAHQGISTLRRQLQDGFGMGLTHEAHIPQGRGLLVGLISGVTLFNTIETKGKGLACDGCGRH